MYSGIQCDSLIHGGWNQDFAAPGGLSHTFQTGGGLNILSAQPARTMMVVMIHVASLKLAAMGSFIKRCFRLAENWLGSGLLIAALAL